MKARSFFPATLWSSHPDCLHGVVRPSGRNRGIHEGLTTLMRQTFPITTLLSTLLLLFGAGAAPAVAAPTDPDVDISTVDDFPANHDEGNDTPTPDISEAHTEDPSVTDPDENADDDPPAEPSDEGDSVDMAPSSTAAPPEPEGESEQDPGRLPRTFVDVPSDNKFKDQIAWLGNTTISQGWELSDGTFEFRPGNNISREAMAAFVFRLAQWEDHPSATDYSPPSTAQFSDVPTDHDFYTEISWLAAQRITTGYTDGTFKPSNRISREAIAAFLFRYADNTRNVGTVKLPSKPLFSDVPKKNAFQKEITWIAQQGISTGYKRDYGCYEFKPRAKATREAMAAFIYRLTQGGVTPITPDCNPPPPKPPAPKLPPVTRTVQYVVAKDGAITTSFETFKKQVDQTLNDPNGWRRAGIEFKQVKSGGSLTVVLANANQVPSYAPWVCDSYYSCRVGRYAIINQDRWKGATPMWNNAGKSIRDYRHMVVNHEVGHWLGLFHAPCGGAGQKAPVMQQQSINLQGCKPNPWPLDKEINKIR